jgi:hypothetical protein
VDILRRIADILVDDYQFATCSSLNLCSHQVYEATLPCLWKTVYLLAESFSVDEVLYHYLWDAMTEGEGWKHTR